MTEEEVVQGIFRSESPNEKVLCYQRALEGLNKEEIDPDAPKYLDLAEGKKVDKDAETLRKRLLKEKLPKAVNQNNIKTYSVQWKGQALEKAKRDRDYEEYLRSFCQDFVEDMKKLVDKNVKYLLEKRKGEVDGLYEEVLHHSQFAKAKCEIFCGREQEIDVIKSYLQGITNERHPFVIHTKSGYGKTALMAYVSSHIQQWLGPEAVLVLRFLGTSPQSSAIVSLLRSVIQQICVVFGLKLPPESAMEMFSGARRCMWSVLSATMHRRPQRPLVLILDAVDQLQESYGAYEFLWLMRTLPPNVYVIVSMLSDKFHLVENAKAKLGPGTPFLELPVLPESTGAEIVDCYLRANNRVVTAEQKKLILSAFEKNRQALFLKLILDSAKMWNSYTPVETIKLATTVHQAITFLFADLEITYGKVFVQNALGYLTCGRGGLSPLEMEDILSCDNACMSEIYQYHDPPLQGVVRIPSLMWSRVQHALQEYLTERQVDGKSVMAWYHRQFQEAAEKRFTKPDSRRQELHFALSELFMQEEGITKTVILHHRNGKVIEEADRCVTPQPLKVQNRRKLNALPYHLLHSGRVEPLKKNCLLNFEFLFTKLRAFHINALFNEYRDLSERPLLAEEEDVKLFLDLLQLCYNALSCDPNLFAYHVMESLKPCCDEHPLLGRLVTDAHAWIENSNIPLLLPVGNFRLEPANSPLKFSMLIGYDGALTTNEEYMVCSWAENTSKVNKVNCINLKTKDIVASVTTEKTTPVVITHDDKRFIFGEATEMRICEISSGDQIKRFPHLAQQYEKVTVRCLTLSHHGKLAAVAIRCGKPKNANAKWKQTCRLALINLEQCETVKEVEFPGKKFPEKIYFVNGDRKLIVSAKDKILTVSVPEMTIEQRKVPSAIFSQAQQLVEDKQALISGVAHGKVAKVCVWNHATDAMEFSDNVHGKERDAVTPFALCVNDDDASTILVGTNVNTATVYEESLCLWDRKQDTYTYIPLTHQPYKVPSQMKVHPDWRYAFVGWSNGYLAAVDLEGHCEISVYHAHGHAIYNITFLDEGRQFITMSQDHCLKLWDFNRQIKKCAEEYTTAQEKAKRVEVINLVEELDEKEESLELDATNAHAITAASDHSKAPRVWRLEDGMADTALMEALQKAYTASMEEHNSEVSALTALQEAYMESTGDNNPEVNPLTAKVQSLKDPSSAKTHGVVHCLPNGVMLYERKRRDFIAAWAFSMGTPDPRVLGQHATMGFLRVLTPGKTQKQKYIVVKDGEVDILSFPGFVLEDTIPVPKISDDIPNVQSSGGKKRLMYYKAAVTTDGKYLVIADPANGKFFDVVDLEQREYVARQQLLRYVKWNLLDDSCCFLVEVAEEGLGIYPPGKLVQLKKAAILNSVLIHSEKFLSADWSLGFEIQEQEYAVRVWQVDDACANSHACVKRLHVLSGHVHGVTALSVSPDNQYLATGSYDNTARIWSLTDGVPLCMFHAYGAIDKVVLTPSLSHLVIQCYAAPQRKRGLILKIQNL